MATKAKKKTDLAKWLNRFHCGDAAELAPHLPAASVDCVITSPPYFRQRDYGNERQLGHEPTPQLYIERLVLLFAAIRPALKATGSIWVVMGDKYLDNQLLGMPWRFALAMQDAGWLLRSDCIWQKPNAMPSAVKTRPTTDHEYIFFFSKSTDYFYDAYAVREPHVTFSENSKMRGGRKHFGKRGGTPE
ncbi:MAG: DNA methyltransferase, partial [Pirellulaceae bacterium]